MKFSRGFALLKLSKVILSSLHVLFLTLYGTPAALNRWGGSLGPGIVKGRKPVRNK